jgi:L-seryl-tRNA(Ser) seleniumtransferase
MTRWGLPKEPTVQETVAAGASLVTFSGDKLLGGPQAGLIVGRADLIGKIRKHPLKRALRVGKLTLAALEPVLTLYRSPEFLAERLTTLTLLTRPAAAMQAQALRLRSIVQAAVGDAFEVTDVSVVSQIGSGALPVDRLASHGLAIRVVKGRRGSLDHLESLLRGLPRPLIGRVADKALWLDLRCLLPSDEPAFERQCDALAALTSAERRAALATGADKSNAGSRAPLAATAVTSGGATDAPCAIGSDPSGAADAVVPAATSRRAP